MNDRFLRACRREPVDRTPIWLMRQAGRYLPEYQALRAKYDMLTLCRTPDLAVTVTLQPLKRFPFDAAILFSDIMIPVQGMGIDFQIQESIGPVVTNPVRDEAGALNLRVLEPDEDVPFVLSAIRSLRAELGHVPLIGFAGAPFTLASYIVEGKPSRDVLRTKTLMYTDPPAWNTLMSKLAQSLSRYVAAQVRAGAQVIQLFDSWVGALSPADYRRYVLPYSRVVLDAVRAAGALSIHFGTGTATLLPSLKVAGGDVIGVDWRIPLAQAWDALGDIALQGNLDPAVMLASAQIVESHTREILDQAAGRRGHIFNLGHGILPSTPIENVDTLVKTVQTYVI